ncbi:MAG: TlpA family protein disulfide reductase [Deltaproteobacteria bacterium]|nr:TlpA family protein disulfide reductase [Deltaproteobacteria bacterium]
MIAGVLLVAVGSVPFLAPLDPPAGPGALAPNLTTDGEAVVLSWLEPTTSSTRGPHRLRTSRLEGRSWSEPETITESDRIIANWADVPSIAVAKDGARLASWAERSGDAPYAYDVILARAPRAGPWQHIGKAHDDRTPTEHGFVSIVPFASHFRVFWLDGREMDHGGVMSLRTATIDRGGTRAHAVLDERTCECCATSAAIGAGGPIIAYRDRDASEVRDIFVLRWTPKGWSAPAPVSADRWKIPGCPVNGPALDARARDVVVAWFTGADGGKVEVAFSSDGGARFGPAIRADIEGPRPPLGRADVVLDGEGAIVLWLESRSEREAMIRLRRISPSGKAGDPVDVASLDGSRASGFPRIARRGNEVIIVWREIAAPARLRARALSLQEIPMARRAPSPAVTAEGASVADYAAKTVDGRTVKLGDLRGRTVLLHLWATWCKPCRDEIPELARLHAELGPKGLTIVGVSIDEAGSRDRVTALIRELKVPYAVWLDPDDRASRLFGAPALPASFLIGPDGAVTWRRLGVIAPGDAEARKAIIDALQRSNPAKGP